MKARLEECSTQHPQEVVGKKWRRLALHFAVAKALLQLLQCHPKPVDSQAVHWPPASSRREMTFMILCLHDGPSHKDRTQC
jgi:hypothetical protein